MIAITREVSDSIALCELTFAARESIDVPRARAQHLAYETALRAVGCEIVRAPDAHQHPDAVFVEDTAVVLDEVAVMTRPGAESRRAETESVAAVLRPYRTLHGIAAPGTLDGGDVLVLGRRVFVEIGRAHV